MVMVSNFGTRGGDQGTSPFQKALARQVRTQIETHDTIAITLPRVTGEYICRGGRLYLNGVPQPRRQA